jgi:plastocyanin
MKKISLLFAVALATFILTACSASPKSDPISASNPNLANVAKTARNPHSVQAPANPSTVSDSATTPPAIDPASVDPRNSDIPSRVPRSPRTAPISAPKLVTIQNFSFSPSSLTINKGETVKWVNKDSMPHTVTSNEFKSDMMKQDNFFTYTFTKAGSFSYACSIHPSMKGAIIVKP